MTTTKAFKNYTLEPLREGLGGPTHHRMFDACLFIFQQELCTGTLSTDTAKTMLNDLIEQAHSKEMFLEIIKIILSAELKFSATERGQAFKDTMDKWITGSNPLCNYIITDYQTLYENFCLKDHRVLASIFRNALYRQMYLLISQTATGEQADLSLWMAGTKNLETISKDNIAIGNELLQGFTKAHIEATKKIFEDVEFQLKGLASEPSAAYMIFLSKRVLECGSFAKDSEVKKQIEELEIKLKEGFFNYLRVCVKNMDTAIMARKLLIDSTKQFSIDLSRGLAYVNSKIIELSTIEKPENLKNAQENCLHPIEKRVRLGSQDATKCSVCGKVFD